MITFEAIMNMIMNLSESCDDNEIHSFIYFVIEIVINTSILNNEKILQTFIVFIDTICPTLTNEKNLIEKIIELLVNVIKNIPRLESVACKVLMEVSDYVKYPLEDSFKVVYNLYNDKYDSLQYEYLSKNSVLQLTEALCHIIGVKKDRQENEIVKYSWEEMVNYFSLIIENPIIRLKQIESYIEKISNLDLKDIDKIKLTCVKNLGVIQKVLQCSDELNENLLNNLSEKFLTSCINLTNNIILVFADDNKFIKEIVITIEKVITHIGSKSAFILKSVNSSLINSFIKNPNNITNLKAITTLYAFNLDNQNGYEYILENFQTLSELILKSIYTAKKNQIELIHLFSNLWNTLILNFKQININKAHFAEVISILNEAISKIIEPDMNKCVLATYKNLILSASKFSEDLVGIHFSNIVFTVFQSCTHFESYFAHEVTYYKLLNTYNLIIYNFSLLYLSKQH